MYIDLLTSSLNEWVMDPGEEELIDHVLACRFEMLISTPRYEENVYSALASEIAYDRSLIKLSEAHGIKASARLFVRPAEERRRLEHALADADVDLTDLAHRRRR
ncbi:MAG: hypothetical protein WAK12_07095 [Acidimicrobiales bacterium]